MNTNLKRTKINRTIYLTVISVLVITACLVAAATTLSRRSEPEVDETTKAETTAKSSAKSAVKSGSDNKKPDAKQSETSENSVPETNNTQKLPAAVDEIDNSAEVAEETDMSEDVSALTKAAALPEFIAPVSGAVAMPHSDSVPVYSMTLNDYRTHSGVDIEASDGENVLAIADGTVKRIWNDPMMGMSISIEHDGGAVSIYQNLKDNSTNNYDVGSSVTRGDVIGCVGESAIVEVASEPHLHFELEIDGISVDPASYISFPNNEQ